MVKVPEMAVRPAMGVPLIFHWAAPAASGTTRKATTDVTSTRIGTSSDEVPRTRTRTIGTKSTSITRSFSATWTSVYAGSPRVSALQTKTTAVHGAAARRSGDH